MNKSNVTQEQFEALRIRFGNHSRAARALGISPEYYRRVRASGEMSETLGILIRTMFQGACAGQDRAGVEAIGGRERLASSQTETTAHAEASGQ